MKKRYLTVAKFTLLFFAKQFHKRTHIDRREIHFPKKRRLNLYACPCHAPTTYTHRIIHCVYASAQENSLYTRSIQQRSRSGRPKNRNIVRSNRTHSTQLFTLPGYRIIVFKRSHRLYQTIFFSQPKHRHSTLQRTHQIHKESIQPRDQILQHCKKGQQRNRNGRLNSLFLKRGDQWSETEFAIFRPVGISKPNNQ